MESCVLAASASAAYVPLSTYKLDVPELIARSELFSGLRRSSCVEIAARARVRRYARNEYLFKQGQAVGRVILVVSGTIKMVQINSNGSEVILWLCGPGEAVGIFGIPSQSNHTCSAQSITDCRALSWDWSSLCDLPVSADIRGNISRIMSNRIRELEVRFLEIATEKVSVRVALALIRILDRIGRPTCEGVEICLSREDLAQLTGTTLFTVSRLMSRWKDQGIIEPRREAVLIRDPARLLETCNNPDVQLRKTPDFSAHEPVLPSLMGQVDCSVEVDSAVFNVAGKSEDTRRT